MTFSRSEQTAPELKTPIAGPPVQWLAVAVGAVAILTFCPILSNDFITFDDGVLVSQNPDFNPPHPSQWSRYWSAPDPRKDLHKQLYMPLTYTLWGIISLAAGLQDKSGNHLLNPVLFHGVSLLLHGINAVLVFLILRKLSPGEWPALFGALLFAVHPLQTESIAWVASTSVLLSGTFSLWAILEFLHFTDLRTHGSGSWTPRIHYWLGTFALALALLSKAPSVVVPALVLAIELFLRRRSWRRLVGPLGLWGLMCVPIVILTPRWQAPHFTVPLIQRPVVAADALAFYIYKFLLPVNLLLNYGRTPAWLMAHRAVADTTWLGPLALIVPCIVLWRRARWVAVASLLFTIAFMPVLGLTVFLYQRFSTTADRYAYLAILGPALALACLIAPKPRKATIVVLGALLTLLAALSIRQATFWSDSVELFTCVIAADPNNHQGQDQVAVAYIHQSLAQTSAGNRPAALKSMVLARDHFLMAAALPEDEGISSYNAGWCEFRLGHMVEATTYADAALSDPKCPLRSKAYLLKGMIYEKNPQRLLKAQENYEKALLESEASFDRAAHDSAVAAIHKLALRQSMESNSTQPSGEKLDDGVEK